MILTLRTTSYTAAVFIALILGFLLLLGSRQYRSHKEYENIIEQNEKIIFQFATIREHITESLLENKPQQLNTITGEIENLNVNISQVLQRPIIPDEYRISFAGQVDFAGITLLLRSIGAGDQTQAKIRQLNQEIRVLGERLMLFDRVIVEHVKRKLVGFQSFVIGLLAIILFIVVYILLFWHRQIAVPLIDLVRQAREVTSGKRAGIAVRKKSGEVAELAGSFQNILSQQHRTSSQFAYYNKVLETVHRVSDAVWKVQTRDAIFSEACRGVLTNTDYILAWIGLPGNGSKILPLIADGSTTMSRQERDECMAALLNAAEGNPEKYDAAGMALENRQPVVLHDVTQDLPGGPFKNTPFASRKADCIGLPLIYDQQIFGVMTIYSTSPFSFTEEEIELLKGMSRELVFAMFALEARESGKTLARLKAARKNVFENNHDIILITRADGTIIEANPSAESRLGAISEKIAGASLYDFFRSDETAGNFLDKAWQSNDNLNIVLKDSESEYTANISTLKSAPDEDETYLLIARDLSEKNTHRSEIIKASKLAAMGELSVGVANEINNLTNGLINYTQILSEEIENTASSNSRELLNNLISESERISQIVQQLLFFNSNHSHTRESIKLNKIIEDSFSLTAHQFRYDGIDVSMNFPAVMPSVMANAREMQHVFLNILSNARYALNQKFTGQDKQKRIEIKAETVPGSGTDILRVTCTDFGGGIHPNIISKVTEPFFSTKPEGVGTGLGLSICRGLLENNNGSLAIESVLDDHTTISIEFPVVS